MSRVRKDPNPTKSTGGLPAVTPIQVDRVRRSVLDIVRKTIPDVREVLDGKREWNAQQTRVFGMLLNKVMPDLHHSFNEHTVENKQVTELSMEELEAIVAKSEEIEDGELVTEEENAPRDN
jgi:O-succinylbenzoate synthase